MIFRYLREGKFSDEAFEKFRKGFWASEDDLAKFRAPSTPSESLLESTEGVWKTIRTVQGLLRTQARIIVEPLVDVKSFSKYFTVLLCLIRSIRCFSCSEQLHREGGP